GPPGGAFRGGKALAAAGDAKAVPAARARPAVGVQPPMPRLTFPIGPDGLMVDVLVNVEASALLPLRASGQPSSPVAGRGAIDTASDISGVSSPALQRLGVPTVRTGPPTGGPWLT